MNDQLVHIFDDSTCLTKRQLRDYVTGVMGDEECHAAEVHLNSCPFCSDAVDGMMMHKDEAARLLADLNPDFLKEHFAQSLPQVHLNAIAVPVDQPVHGKKKKNNVRPLWRTASVAAALLFCTGIVWYYSYQKDSFRNNQVAKDMPATVHTPSPDNKMIAQTTPPGPDENDRRDAGPLQPVAPLPVVPEQKENKENVLPESGAATAEKTTVAPASAAGKLASDSVQLAYTPDAKNYNLYNNNANIQGYSYSSTPNDARPFYGNAYTNRNQSFSRAQEYTNLKRLNTDKTDQPSQALNLRARSAATKDADVQKAPANSQAEVVAAAPPKQSSELNIGGARTEGSVYVIDGVQQSRSAKEEGLSKKKWMAPRTEDPDDLYSKGDYKAALAGYNKDMGSSNKSRRHYAVMGAARCYMNMGQEAKAKQLLQSLVDEGGAQSRAAKKMLRKINGDTQ